MAVLRDVAHAHLGAVADGSFRDVLSVEQNFTAGYFFQSREALNELGLAVSIDTCDADNLAVFYIEGSIVDGVVSVRLARYGHVLYFQIGVDRF